jgi:hypothetical protein
MTTCADVITLALKDCQVLDERETPSAALMADSMATLNQMLALWQAVDATVYAVIDETFVPTSVSSYTIGTGGVINVAAPQSITYAFYSENGVDYPLLSDLQTFNSYQEIPVKTITGIPSYYFYNKTYPLGTLYLYPCPTGGLMHIGINSLFPIHTAAANSINLPDHYVMPIRYNLYVLLAASMGIAVNPALEKIAKNTKRVLMRNNVRLEELRGGTYDDPVGRIRRGPYY